MPTSSPDFKHFVAGNTPIPRLLSLLSRLARRHTPHLESQVELVAYARKLASNAEVVFAHVDDHDIGLIAFYANDSLKRLAFLSTIAIDFEYESAGIGKRLLDYALKISAERGMTQIRLAVAVRNSHALEFYLRQGFSPLPCCEPAQVEQKGGPVLFLERPCAITDGHSSTHPITGNTSNSPFFSAPLHVGRPNIGNRTRLLGRISDMLDRRWFTNGGPYVREFEQKISQFLGVRHSVAMCNATVALEVVCRALGLKGEVIMPAYTFPATPHAFQWQQVRPRFADIDSHTHNLNPASVEKLITPRTSAIIGVHIWGRACDTDALAAIAYRHGIHVLYDAAHAFGCSHKGRMIGSFGRCEVFSFHATKFLNSFEGGVITTNDDHLAEKFRLMRNFGFTGVDQVTDLGINGKMTEVCAAMGLTSLEAMDDLVAVNRRNYEAYLEAFADLPGLTVLRYDKREKSNYQYIVIEVEPKVCPISRDDLVARLQTENILARRYFFPGCHRMEPYRSRPGGVISLPATERVAACVMLLPTGQTVTTETIRRIGCILRSALA